VPDPGSTIEANDATAPANFAIAPWLLAAAATLVALASFATIGFFPLSEPDEARYAEIPREMLLRGDWVTPHLNYVKYFEKPPLMYWLVAATFAAAGFSEFAARAWPVVFGLSSIAMVFVLGRAMWNREAGALAAALLATFPLHFGMSQILTLDMPLSAMLTLASGSFWLAYARPRQRRGWVLVFYAMLAAALLTKGPVALVLTGGIIAAFIAVRREWSIVRWLLSPSGILLFLAIALPWHFLVAQRNPEFFDFYIVDQHFNRYLRPQEHREPIWFFVPVVLGGAAPWSLLPLAAPRLMAAKIRALLAGRVGAGTLFCVLWAAVVFTFFSLSGSKLATYIIPLFPPLALLLARTLQHTRHRHAALFASGASLMLVAGILCACGNLAVREFVDDPNGPIIASRLGLAAVVLTACGIVARAKARRQQTGTALAVLLLGVLLLQLVAISGRGLAPDYRALGEAIAAQARGDDIVVSYHHYTQGIPLYGGRRTAIVAARGELTFGSRQGDHSEYFWETDAELIRRWSTEQRLFLVISRTELEEIRTTLQPPPRTIAGAGKKVVVVNFPT